MNASQHVVLGGNGVVGRETLSALIAQGHTPASVGRRPSSVEGVNSVAADLLDSGEVARASRGAEVAYLVTGLPYSSRVWAEQWPVIVRNSIDAALEHGTHLVYLDNVYAYGHVDGAMIESTPVNPCSKKGRVRADALDLLEKAADRGLTVTIGRSANFYGPGASTSVFNTFALDKVAAGKSGTWLLNADQPHSLTYTPDIGRGLAVLGTHDEARGRTWHLPTAPALTGRRYIELAGGQTSVMGATTLRIGALFNSSARETLEMSYQYTAPYVFSSAAFEQTFRIGPTPVEEGIAASQAKT
ncbi:NAD-dependent epimerase/dehydratase family protein [Kineosporia rhizophila]|uniref:NAD-dependent epimerase/dehydratase family protein n=1 Tax=Kineosporia rhizophila TaxID=84633 RepID=UPI001E57AB2F|nr:NAD-dependent epimerase/dehydratase family protein [Kineosporia rhizophila]MCE0540849.1 NAD-dependent epimerase/dehydratase family protein [Kineosporia rhizophila]